MQATFQINANEDESRQFTGGDSPLAALLNRPARLGLAAEPARALPPAEPAAERGPRKLPGGRQQKLASRQLAVGEYLADYKGHQVVAKRDATGWQLVIDDKPGRRRFDTKRHAMNYARVLIDDGKLAAPAPPPVVKPAPAVAAAPPQAAPVAPAARKPFWRSPAAPWRQESATGKQYRLLGHLSRKLAEVGQPAPAIGDELTKGAASDLIDSMKAALGLAAKTSAITCSIGPFARGFCTVCGLRRKIGRPLLTAGRR